MSEIDLKLIVPTAIAVVSLLVSLAVAFRNWRYSKTSVRYTYRNQYMNGVFDINRQLVNHPELWAIYDDHPMSSPGILSRISMRSSATWRHQESRCRRRRQHPLQERLKNLIIPVPGCWLPYSTHIIRRSIP